VYHGYGGRGDLLRLWERTENFSHWEASQYHDKEFEALMKFRLTYQGPLFATTSGRNRAEHKHDIRKQFHEQLTQLWKTHPLLKQFYDNWTSFVTAPGGTRGGVNALDRIASNHVVGNSRFVPLVSRGFGIACGLDILFLRRELPGEIVKHGGDLDNRIKTLFDALRVPEGSSDEWPSYGDSNLFFVLLEDDALITDLNVSTDRLLVPTEGDSTHEKNNVLLVIQVETVIVNPALSNLAFGIP
jgi:hypothetical protein